jgi:hypothetical protein
MMISSTGAAGLPFALVALPSSFRPAASARSNFPCDPPEELHNFVK